VAKWEAELAVAVRAAEAAGREALRFFERDPHVQWKADRSPVSEADFAADRAITSALREAFPDDAILTEESGATAGASGRRWIVDPIDGTRPFLRGIPDWSNLIALEALGEIVVGVLHLPAHGELYAAARGLGTTKNGVTTRVAATTDLERCVITMGQLPNALRGMGAAGFARLVGAVGLARAYGDARGPALVLSGHVDACFEHDVQLWDIAPFPVLFEEAGATYTDFTGARRWPTRSGFAANPALHAQLLRTVRGEPAPPS
jgi:histidinol phosphatase-like enzyme (inositol monophosphatase family)